LREREREREGEIERKEWDHFVSSSRKNSFVYLIWMLKHCPRTDFCSSCTNVGHELVSFHFQELERRTERDRERETGKWQTGVKSIGKNVLWLDWIIARERERERDGRREGEKEKTYSMITVWNLREREREKRLRDWEREREHVFVLFLLQNKTGLMRFNKRRREIVNS
jgi:hypothetical protein